MTTLLIDNYDSFTYNLYQYLSEMGADVIVHRNDKISVEECVALRPDHVVISPGPGAPKDAGISNDVIRAFAGKVPVLGVCLGHQCIYEVYGGDVAGAGEIVHGKTSTVSHDEKGVFAGIPRNFKAVRYHSLAGTPATQPAVLEVTAHSESGVIMGVRHRELKVEGVQFHPESICDRARQGTIAQFPRDGGRTMVIQDALRALIDDGVLTDDMATATMHEIMRGEATQAQIGAYLAALRLRGESASVIAASAKVMRDHAERIPVEGVIDIVGTGGDGIDTFNVSTAAALVVAAAGGKVAKHGNRAMSSQTGSADVLEALGANTDLDAAGVARVINGCGFCFVFAQRFHPAMRHVAGPRRELGVRTIFNLLGPLTNPARPRAQLTGVASAAHAPMVAEALALSGIEKAIIVRSTDGLDEISPSAPTQAWFVERGTVREQHLTPADFGLPAHPLESVKGGAPAENAATMRALLAGQTGAILDFVLMNASAALVVAGLADDLWQGVRVAGDAIASGRARQVLDDYVRLSQEGRA